MSQPQGELQKSLGKFKHLKRVQHRLSSSSATTSQADAPRSPSSYRLDSDKSSFLDVFNCKRPIERSQSSREPTAKKVQTMCPRREYNPEKYYSSDIEDAIQRMLQQNTKKPVPKAAPASKQASNAIRIENIPLLTIQQPNKQKVIAPTLTVQPSQVLEEPDISPFPPANEPTQLAQCQSCFRSFNLTSFAKHQTICQKVFFKKRRAFDSSKQRVCKPPTKG